MGASTLTQIPQRPLRLSEKILSADGNASIMAWALFLARLRRNKRIIRTAGFPWSITECIGRAILEHERSKADTARLKPTTAACGPHHKDEAVAAYSTRLSKAHLTSELKDVLIMGILEVRYGRKAVAAWSNN
jgi:hypothetical protein